MHYIVEFFHGNPAAAWLLTGFIALIIIAFIHDWLLFSKDFPCDQVDEMVDDCPHIEFLDF